MNAGMGSQEPELRSMEPEDRSEVAELIYCSINFWYRAHGGLDIFRGGPGVTEIFYDVYNDLTPGCNVVAVNPRTGRLMGSCFYHPREHHVSLGIMNVHPNYFGIGVARRLLGHVIDFTEREGYNALRLTQSTLNLDSFSLYTRAGFVPRSSYQDMVIRVPETGLALSTPERERVRDATAADVPAMAALELSVSGISRELDYGYCIRNERGFWHSSVLESRSGGLDGFMISSGHPAMNALGPCIARTEEDAAALILRELDLYRGRTPLCLVPMDKGSLVRRLYDLGGRNVEMHFCQVRGEFKPFEGVSMPTFLPETA